MTPSPPPLYGDPRLREVAVPVATVWTSPDAPRDLDALATADRPDVEAWTRTLDAEGTAEPRTGLHGRTLTQLLLGEPALMLEERDGWVRVAGPHQRSSGHGLGYLGWVRRAHLTAPVPRHTGVRASVVVPAVRCQVDGDASLEISCGTALWVAAVEEDHVSVSVHLPGGRTGTLPLEAVRLTHDAQQPTFGADDLLATARQFLGLRYLWGGTSAWGLDCSGLVHLTLRAHGVALPRDAFDQAAATDDVVPVPLDEVRPGDLYFFARPGERVYHVGFATAPVGADGSRRMLHAPEGGAAAVEDAPMAADRVDKLVAAGRVRKPDAGQLATYDVSPR